MYTHASPVSVCTSSCALMTYAKCNSCHARITSLSDPWHIWAHGLQGFTKTLMYRYRHIPIFTRESHPIVFCQVKEQHFPSRLKCNNLPDNVVLYSFRCHLFPISFPPYRIVLYCKCTRHFRINKCKFAFRKKHPWPPKKNAFPH